MLYNDLSSLKIETIKKIKKMSDYEVNATHAFINSLDDVKDIFYEFKTQHYSYP